jgi:hypothetical protein
MREPDILLSETSPNMLWIIPITEEEREPAMRRGSAEVVCRLSESGVHGPGKSVARRDGRKGLERIP